MVKRYAFTIKDLIEGELQRDDDKSFVAATVGVYGAIMHEESLAVSAFIVGQTATVIADVVSASGFNTVTYPKYRIIGESDHAVFIAAVMAWLNGINA